MHYQGKITKDQQGPGFATPNHRGTSRLPLIVAGLFLVLLVAGAFTATWPMIVPGLYAGVSILTFVAYYRDKSAARNNRWRTRESTLHLLALLGGWPGALIAQNRLRHKSRKLSFQVVFVATVLVNCAALGWALTAPAAHQLRSALAVLH